MFCGGLTRGSRRGKQGLQILKQILLNLNLFREILLICKNKGERGLEMEALVGCQISFSLKILNFNNFFYQNALQFRFTSNNTRSNIPQPDSKIVPLVNKLYKIRRTLARSTTKGIQHKNRGTKIEPT